MEHRLRLPRLLWAQQASTTASPRISRFDLMSKGSAFGCHVGTCWDDRIAEGRVLPKTCSRPPRAKLPDLPGFPNLQNGRALKATRSLIFKGRAAEWPVAHGCWLNIASRKMRVQPPAARAFAVG